MIKQDLIPMMQQAMVKDIQEPFFKILSKYILGACYFFGTDMPQDDVLFKAKILEGDIQKRWKTLTLEEIQFAFNEGCRSEEGSFIKMTNATFNRWIDSYFKSPERAWAKNEIRQQKALPEKAPLSEGEKKQIIHQGALDAFVLYKQTKKLIDFGNITYDYLDSKGLISFTPERKHEFMNQARQTLIEQTKYKVKMRTTSVSSLQDLLSGDALDLVVREAKLLALKTFFNDLIEMETDLETLLETDPELPPTA